MTRIEYLSVINGIIEEEAGIKLRNEDSLLREADLDSFAHTILFITLDTDYDYFGDVRDDVDVFATIDWDTISAKVVIDRLMNCGK